MEKKSWFAFSLAIIIILAIPLSVLLIFSHVVTGHYFPVIAKGWAAFSSNSEEWSRFGSLLSGLFGLSSALATMITLGFVIYQANETIRRSDQQARNLKQEQEQQNKKIDSHNKDITEFHEQIIHFHKEVGDFNKRVVAFNEMQQKRDVFDKYRLHKQEFNSLLDDIIYDLDDFYGQGSSKITRRNELYRSIFPRNNFESFSIKSIQFSPEDFNLLERIYSFAKHINNWINHHWEEIVSDKVLKNIQLMHLLINLEINTSTNANGEIFLRASNKYIISIDSFEEEIKLLINISNRILSFAGNPNIDFRSTYDHCFLKANLFELHKELSSNEEYLDTYSVYRHKQKAAHIGLLEIYKLAVILNKRFNIYLAIGKGELRVFLTSFFDGENNRKMESGARAMLERIENEVMQLTSKNRSEDAENLEIERLFLRMKLIIDRSKYDL